MPPPIPDGGEQRGAMRRRRPSQQAAGLLRSPPAFCAVIRNAFGGSSEDFSEGRGGLPSLLLRRPAPSHLPPLGSPS
eukprot:3341574-Pyramimonas_sp.AAC.1